MRLFRHNHSYLASGPKHYFAHGLSLAALLLFAGCNVYVDDDHDVPDAHIDVHDAPDVHVVPPDVDIHESPDVDIHESSDVDVHESPDVNIDVDVPNLPSNDSGAETPPDAESGSTTGEPGDNA